MGFFSSSPKYTHAWVYAGTNSNDESREIRSKVIANKYGIDPRNVEFYSLDHAMSEYSRMQELRGPTKLPYYDDVITQQRAWHELTEGRGVIWHEKGDRDTDWPKHNFMKFSKI